MRKLTSAMVLLVLFPLGLFGKLPADLRSNLPDPPDVEHGTQWLAHAFKEYQERQAMLPYMEGNLPEFTEPSDDGWDKVRQLAVGKEIRVVDLGFKKIKGRFLRATDGAIFFRASKNGRKEEITIPRHDVRMVSIRHSRAKPILQLLLAGALMGASAMMNSNYNGCYCGWGSDRWGFPSGKQVAIAAGIGAAALGLLGAFTEPGDEAIYFHNPRGEVLPAPIEGSLVPPDATPPEPGSVPALVGPPSDGPLEDSGPDAIR